MLVASNSRQTLSFFGYLEDLNSPSKLLLAWKAQGYCFPSRECQEVTNAAEKSPVSPKSHSTYTFNTKTLTWEVLLQGTEKNKHYNSLPTDKTRKYELKRFCKVPKSFALARFAQVCMLEFSASLTDLKPFVSTKCSVACSCSNCILVGTNLGSYTIFHAFLSCSQHAVHPVYATLHLLQQQSAGLLFWWIPNMLWDAAQDCQVCWDIFGAPRACQLTPGQWSYHSACLDRQGLSQAPSPHA